VDNVNDTERPSDPALLALASADQAFPGDSEADRVALRSALEAAAVPHWCNAAVLTALVDDSGLLGPSRWDRLKALPVIEPCPAQGADAGRVPAASRQAIRKFLAGTQRERFLELSRRMVRLLAADTRPASRIEWIYHLLAADAEQGAAGLAELNRRRTAESRHEDLMGLAGVLAELDGSGLLQGKAQVRARLIAARCRADVAGATSLGEEAHELLRAAETAGEPGLVAEAQSLVGDVVQARGDLAAAEHAYRQALTISQQLAQAEPGNAGRQQDLARAYRPLGDVAQERGDLAAAGQAVAEYLAICERMAMLDPADTGWQRMLGLAHGRVGGIARETG
jgi:tetratricopeptide (TPR) repeat protein